MVTESVNQNWLKGGFSLIALSFYRSPPSHTALFHFFTKAGFRQNLVLQRKRGVSRTFLTRPPVVLCSWLRKWPQASAATEPETSSGFQWPRSASGCCCQSRLLAGQKNQSTANHTTWHHACCSVVLHTVRDLLSIDKLTQWVKQL